MEIWGFEIFKTIHRFYWRAVQSFLLLKSISFLLFKRIIADFHRAKYVLVQYIVTLLYISNDSFLWPWQHYLFVKEWHLMLTNAGVEEAIAISGNIFSPQLHSGEHCPEVWVTPVTL